MGTLRDTTAQPVEEVDEQMQTRIEAIGDQLRSKINSKFQTSTFLAGFGFAVLGIQITILWQSTGFPRLLPISQAFMLVAIVLYITAVYKLDGLTMPKRFWEKDEGHKDRRASHLSYLTQQDLWELKKRMIFYWMSLTVTATIITAASLFLMLLPLPPRKELTECLTVTQFYIMWLLPSSVVYLLILSLIAKYKFNPLMRPKD
jgi:hypothetical protein